MHVLNRAVRRAQLFSDTSDYHAFEDALVEAHDRIPVRLLAFCVMPNHWHMIVWPREEGDLSRFMQRLTVRHATRWHASRATSGTGHVYQARFKSVPVQSDGHLLQACRYVERNALRANLVKCAEEWRWGSLWHRLNGDPARLLSRGPIELPVDWTRFVNEPQSGAELDAMRRSVRTGMPFGSEAWARDAAVRLGLESTFRPRGRPRKGEKGDRPLFD